MEDIHGKIERIGIADEDVMDWLKFLQESGYSAEEIDGMIGDLNTTFGMQKMPSQLRNQFNRLVEGAGKRKGKPLSEEERRLFYEKFKALIERH